MNGLTYSKTRLYAAWSAGILLSAVVLALVASPARGAEVYTIDTAHSSVDFKVRHLFSNVPGKFSDVTGTLHYDPEAPERSRIELTIAAAGIDTGNDKRDAHLRSEDFLFVERFPTITFVSTKIEATGLKDIYRVTGDFTLHGVTKPITVDAEILGFGTAGALGYRGGFSARASFDRSDFGVTWNKTLDVGGALVGNTIQVDASLEVIRQESEEIAGS